MSIFDFNNNGEFDAFDFMIGTGILAELERERKRAADAGEYEESVDRNDRGDAETEEE